MTRAASGASAATETVRAVHDAVGQARPALGAAPTLGFLFVSARHRLDVALAAAREAAGCDVVGCTTAGEFTERGKTTGGVAVLLTTLDPQAFAVTNATGVKADPAGAARQLAGDFAGLMASAARRGWGLSSTVLLVDGLAGTGEVVVKELLANTRAFQQVVGGAAGDDGRFKETWTGSTRQSGADAAVAVHVFGKTGWGIGVDHGLRPRSKTMTVTRADGNVLHELDGRPAIEAYQSYAKERGVTLTPENTGQFLIGNELGVFFLNELHHARAPVGVGPRGELKLVASITQGAKVCILDGEPDSMVSAAGRAAEAAKAALGDAPVAGVLVFDCICRGLILDAAFQREIDAVRARFPDTPVAGFLTYGEIARFRGKLDGWHNTTTVVLAIPA
ncbi:MAG: FIST N-terminal domain-containing protein [Myxococcota bacterium]|jgi:methyl-accepting chemotaxis protein